VTTGGHVLEIQPCCCADGTYCVRPVGCLNSDEYGGAFYTEFPISVVETATGLDVSGSPATGSQPDPACFTLAGGTEYTVTIAKDRWTTYTATFTTPCSDLPWTLSPLIPMVPADGYTCPCVLNISPPCVEPVKLPLVHNDGFGDVEMPPAFGVCVPRTAMNAATSCACEEATDIDVPVRIGGLGHCNPSIAPVRWCKHFDAYGVLQKLIVAGDCDDPPCDPEDFVPCGAMDVLSTSVTCSPYTITATVSFTGCLREIYGAGGTYIIMESA
jgi:hypothetical protein